MRLCEVALGPTMSQVKGRRPNKKCHRPNFSAFCVTITGKSLLNEPKFNKLDKNK